MQLYEAVKLRAMIQVFALHNDFRWFKQFFGLMAESADSIISFLWCCQFIEKPLTAVLSNKRLYKVLLI